MEPAAVGLWEDACNVVRLDRRSAIMASLRYYLSYGASAFAFLAAIYLVLPLLRDAGARGGLMVPYELSVPGGRELVFSLPWAVPLLAAVLASWCLALSKRVEYRLWWAGHDAVFSATSLLLAGDDLGAREHRRLEAMARATGMALRQLALSGLELLQLLVAAGLLLVLEPLALLFATVVAAVLAGVFRSAIWPREGGGEEVPEEGLQRLIGHRLRMSNAQKVFATLMPITALLMLASSRMTDLFSFDLAGLLFLCLLVSALGTALGGLMQHLLRFQRRSALQQEMLSALCAGDRDRLQALLAGEGLAVTDEAEDA